MRSHLRSPVVLLLLLPWAHPASAQGEAADSFIGSEMKRQRIPGLAMAVVKDGAVVQSRGYGLANVELDVPATTDTVFEIASITKPSTAQAIMLLVEDGNFALGQVAFDWNQLIAGIGDLPRIVGVPVGAATALALLRVRPAE
jgi:CubicO group peptidase (beta-lactamase class C family)